MSRLRGTDDEITKLCFHQYGKYNVSYGLRLVSGGVSYYFIEVNIDNLASHPVLLINDNWFKLDEERIERLLVLK